MPDPATCRGTAPVVGLDDRAAVEPGLTGAKAAALAKATRAGLPVLPGVVLTTGATRSTRVDGEPLRAGWDRVSRGGTRSVVVRSSSTAEDGAVSSMAGQFASVLDVRGWRPFLDAVAEVVASADAQPMAVLVQPFLDPAYGGVLFGADPVTARRNRVVVSAVHGGPHRLVHGQVSGDRWTLTPHGRVVYHQGGPDAVMLGPARRWALTGLARRAAALLGGPQDIEWAFDRAGKLWLLQSRPITAVPPSVDGPVYGPGPVAETFPEPLAPLEEDLWLDPLRVGLREALALTGTASRRALRRRPLVVSVGGRVAADLHALGVETRGRPLLARLDPRPPGRRLVAAWRVGRLQAALPALADDVVREVDARLAEVPRLRSLGDADLLTLLERSRQTLVAVHGYEVLAGLLVRSLGETGTTAAAEAVRALARGRAAGLDDDELVARHPLTLALTAPCVGQRSRLPSSSDGEPGGAADGATTEPMAAREALRLRARWLQEVGARAAWELGRRLAVRELLVDPADVRYLHLSELTAAVSTGAAPVLAIGRAVGSAAPLPTRFRLAVDGTVVPLADRRNGPTGRAGAGVGAGGGRGVGPVHRAEEGEPPEGAVLVVRHLEPGLAPLLPRLAGLVAETGSPLSHLAILARELGVPVVVAAPDALARFPAGTRLLVDGTTGEVTRSVARSGGGIPGYSPGFPHQNAEVVRS